MIQVKHSVKVPSPSMSIIVTCKITINRGVLLGYCFILLFSRSWVGFGLWTNIGSSIIFFNWKKNLRNVCINVLMYCNVYDHVYIL